MASRGMNRITSETELDALFDQPVPSSILKEVDHITDDYRKLIEASPFAILATSGPEGLDCSPRGDPRGFVRVADSKTLMVPDRRGNNRIDSLRNIVRDPRISLLFLIPGIGTTVRINGRAEITTDPDLCASFVMQGKAPKCVLMVTVDRVYFQCPKALVRSRLWSKEAQISPSELPSTGEILQAITQGTIDGAAYDQAYPQRIKETIY